MRAAAIAASVWMFVAGAAPAGQTQPPVFKSAVDAVQVDVEVTRRNRPIGGLTADDFELRDAGVPQQIRAATIEELPLHLLLVLDTSSSMRGEPLDHLKQAARAAIAMLRPKDRAALLTFSHVIRLGHPWSDDAAAIGLAIDALEANGSTALYDAAYAAIGLRENVPGRMLVLLFTDGVDTSSWLSGPNVLEESQRSDVVFEAVRLESPENRRRPVRPNEIGAMPAQRREWFLKEPDLARGEFLPALADDTGGELLVTSSSRELRAAFVKIIEAFRTRYVLTYTPANVPASGWHPIDVRLKKQAGDIHARRGYAR